MCPVQIINRLAARHPITSIPCVAAIWGLCSDRHTHQFGRRRFLGCVHLKQASIPEILALKPNGASECRWLKYKIVDGSMRKEVKVKMQNLENDTHFEN